MGFREGWLVWCSGDALVFSNKLGFYYAVLMVWFWICFSFYSVSYGWWCVVVCLFYGGSGGVRLFVSDGWSLGVYSWFWWSDRFGVCFFLGSRIRV